MDLKKFLHAKHTSILIKCLFLLYFISMFVYPWIYGKGNWSHVQNVWDRWQSINVGTLAFFSTLFIFYASTNRDENQRKREYLASRAFLPNALSDLTQYLINSGKYLNLVYNYKLSKTGMSKLPPQLPNSHLTIFEKCIKTANPNTGQWLALILGKIQVHNSRMAGTKSSDDELWAISTSTSNLKIYIYRLCELKIMINRSFKEARGQGDIDTSIPTWETFENIYSSLNLNIEIFDDLKGFTKRRLNIYDNEMKFWSE